MAFGRAKQPTQTPVDGAKIALAHGRHVFHAQLDLDDETDATVEEIEALGWKLDRLTFVFVPSRQKARLGDSNVFGSTVDGALVGVYLFRR